MVKSFLLGVVVLSSTLVGSFFHASTQIDSDSTKKPETSTLIVKAEDKDTSQVVVGANVMVYWGDFNDQSKSTQQPTLDTGMATFAKVPRGKVKILVVAQDFETFACFYNIKKAAEAVGIQLDKKKQGEIPPCLVLPPAPKSKPPEAETNPPQN